MPLLSKRIFNCTKPLASVKPDDKVFTIQYTKEGFRSQEEYEKRLQLYKKRIWTCQSTGHVNLTHEEAWNSERAVLKTLKEQFSPCYDKPVLILVHHSTKSLDVLVDEAWLMLQQVLVIGEKVLLKVKSGGKSMKAIIVKVDPDGYKGNPTSNCNSPSSDKENNDDNASPKKWVPPKLLPYKYSIRFENEDSVIHSVPAEDLSRGDKPPSKELLRLFIRTYAVRAGQTSSSPWIVDEAQVKKLDIPSKFASFLLSPIKWRPDEVAKKIDEEVKNHKSPSKNSPRIKTKMDAREEKRKEKVKKSITKLEKKGERAKLIKEKLQSAKSKSLVSLDSSDESDGSDSSDEDEAETAVMVSDSDSDTPLSVVKSMISEDVPLSVVKSKLSAKKKSSGSDNLSSTEDNRTKSPSKTKSPAKTPSKTKKHSGGTSLADLQREMKKMKHSGKSKTELTLADIKKSLEKKKRKELKKKLKEKKTKKGQDPKQRTLFDMSSKKKGLKTPDKKLKSPSKSASVSPLKDRKVVDAKRKLMSPNKTPVIIQKLQMALKKNDLTRIGMYSAQAAKSLTATQRDKLPDHIKQLVMKKYEIMQEKIKLSKMSEEEKKKYLAQKAEERRKASKEKMKKRLKISRRKFEDTDLDLKPLPAAKLVTTPDGLPNDTFGDIVMITEFIACYSGLLMPDNQYPIYTDCLMKALAAGKDGFSYLTRTIIVLLQTLLQDQIAEDYQELGLQLSDIPVNPGTCSELVRLCLRRRDMNDDKSDTSEQEDEDEMADELIQQLESQELHQLEPVHKLSILKGLCQRLMGTYSVQDYMEECQQESARLWREKQAQWKQDKALAKKADEKNKKEDHSKDIKKEEPTAASNTPLLTQFYGKKDGDGRVSGNSSEAAMETDDDDLVSKIKRRRVTAAQAAQERRQRDIENKIKREREMEEQKVLQQKEQLDKNFTEGTLLAKIVQRQTPVGTDRNHSRYWVFCDVTPGIYVEKGWTGEEMEYTCRSREDDLNDSSSSEDEDDEEEQAQDGQPGQPGKRAKPTIAKCVDKTFPHVGQNLWFTYDDKSGMDELIESLHAQGARESVLRKELQKRSQEVFPSSKKQRKQPEVADVDGDKEQLESLQKELLDTELRLRNGGLGGVEDFPAWNLRLETSTEVEPLAQCLLEVQENVLERFRDGIMIVKKKRSAENEDEDEGPPAVAPGIQQWREAVKSAGTLSRLHVMMGILETCIKWEKSAEHAKCKICRKKGEEDRLLLCDECNQAFHIYCLRPALHSIPKGEWKCIGCAPLNRRRVVDLPGKYNENTSDDEDVKQVKSESIKHQEKCVECGGDESLILCAECPDVYHLECHTPPLRRPPRGRWVCNNCKLGITRRKTRTTRVQVQRGKRKKTQYVEESSEQEDTSATEEESEADSDNETDDDADTKPPPKKVPRTTQSAAAGKRRSNTKVVTPKITTSRNTTPKSDSAASKSRKSSQHSPEILFESRLKSSRRAPSELSVIEDIINRLLDFKSAWPFWEMVSKRDVPDYYDIIKQPISFQKIKDRLNCLVYGSPQEVIDAVSLLFRNAVEYNAVGSEVYDCVEQSEKYFVDQLKKHLPFYAYSRGDKKSNGYSDHMYSEGEVRKTRKSK